MDYKYYLSKLKPYYLENIQCDENGDVIRTFDPNTALQKYNPLPNLEMQKKINFFYMPYNHELHTKKYMTFL